MLTFNTVVLVVTVALLVSGIGYIVNGFREHNKEINDLRRTADHYSNRYKTRRGSTTINGELIHYNLLSPDYGKTWIELDQDGRVKRKASTKLIKGLQAFDELSEHLEIYGTLDLGDPKDLELLQKAAKIVNKSS